MKRIHYLSGIILFVFICMHLTNHLFSLIGPVAHIELMEKLRYVYRNLFAEILLFTAVFIQIFSGIKLYLKKRKIAAGFFEQLQLYSGLYLALFFLIHLSAIASGRFIFDLDTNFYFGVAGLNTFPLNLFFIPYYSFAIISFFGHISAVHSEKMKYVILGLKPKIQAYLILSMGVLISFIIIFGLTDGFSGVDIPSAYDIIIGK